MKGYPTQADAEKVALEAGCGIRTDEYGTFAESPAAGIRVRLVDAGADGWFWMPLERA